MRLNKLFISKDPPILPPKIIDMYHSEGDVIKTYKENTLPSS